MTRRRRTGPAPAAPALAIHLEPAQVPDVTQCSTARDLGQYVLGGPGHPLDRVRAAAHRGADMVRRGELERVGVSTTVLVCGMAAGVEQFAIVIELQASLRAGAPA